MTILVLTVGGSHQPLVTAIQTLKPDRVIFLCSDDTPIAKGSYVQIIGEGKVIKSNPKLEKPDLPNIPTQVGLSPDQFDLVKIGHFDNLETCYLESSQILIKLHSEQPHARLIADYTGGTKSMTAGLALAAVESEWCELNLIAGTRTDLEKVKDRSQFARPIAVWDLRGRRKLEEVQVRLSRFDYAGAATLLERIGSMPISESFSDKVRAGLAMCRGLDAWDWFNHHEARSLLQPYRRYLKESCIMLDDLCRAEPRDPYLRVEDLLLNAERRAIQDRYDDAIARIYRALELTVQVRLKMKYGIDTSDIDLQKIPAQRRTSFERHRSDTGKIQVPLFASWVLLQQLDDHLGAWFAENKSKVQDFLGVRNSSILAHGLEPVDSARWQKKGSDGLTLCRQALATVPRSERNEVSVQQLPQRLGVFEKA